MMTLDVLAATSSTRGSSGKRLTVLRPISRQMTYLSELLDPNSAPMDLFILLIENLKNFRIDDHRQHVTSA